MKKAANIKTEGLQRFIHRAKKVTRPEALTPELVHEFIEKIVVPAPEHKDGKCYQEEHIKNKPFLNAKTA